MGEPARRSRLGIDHDRGVLPATPARPGRAPPRPPGGELWHDTLTRAELEQHAEHLARRLQADGVGVGDMVTIALPNSVEWFVAVVAAWKLGAIPQPVSARLPAPELAAIVELAQPAVLVGAAPDQFPGRRIYAGDELLAGPPGAEPSPAAAPLDDATSPAWKAPTSGGSTGRPKLIVAGSRRQPRRRGTPRPASAARRVPGHARAALPQRPHRLVVRRPAVGQPRGRPAPLRRRRPPSPPSSRTGPTSSTWCPP